MSTPQPSSIEENEIILGTGMGPLRFGAPMDEVRTLDEDMKAFKLLDRPLYDGYQQMRKIISSGGGGGGDVKPGKPGVAPGA